MKISAVIAEYNPFHCGHEYQLKKMRENADAVVVIMGGNFTQRGDAACMEKHYRAKAALSCGADLIVELPLPYALNTAERFAFGGVSLANALGCVDELCFGAETGELYPLEKAAQILQDPQLYTLTRDFAAQGITFVRARELAMEQMGFPDMAQVLQTPNNILATEYIGWLMKTDSKICPRVIQRVGSNYHDDTITEFSSATAIRSLMRAGKDFSQYIPQASFNEYQQATADGCAPVFLEDHDRLLLGRLRSIDRESYSTLPDLTEGIENRLWQSVRSAVSYTELIEDMKTKRYTLSRIRRLCISAVLGINGELCRREPPYIRILGFNETGAKVMGKIHESSHLPMSHSLAQLSKHSPLAERFAATEANSTDLYYLLTPSVKPCGLDYTTPAVKL